MAKLLDLLVAAEGFVPVAGRVYAQDWGGSLWGFSRPFYDWETRSWESGRTEYLGNTTQADDHTTAIITAEAILEARACQ